MLELWTHNAPMLVLLTPFCGGLLTLTLRNGPLGMQRLVAVLVTALHSVLGVTLAASAFDGITWVYRLGDWAAPWGIVLVVDALTGWMLGVLSILSIPALMYAFGGTDAQGRHFHTLFQFQLFGLTGAFLTGDLFNLFVFFEVLLIASYGLALHGPGASRTRFGLHYVTLNLSGSAIFLVAVALIYAGLGTLNLADMARTSALLDPDRMGLVRMGAVLLLVVFGLKAAAAPMSLWLPGIYTHCSAPVAALFAIMTKVGVYAIVRLHALVFPANDPHLGDLYTPWLLISGVITLGVGMLRAMVAGRLSAITAALVVASVGNLLIGLSLGSQAWSATLYYLAHSTLVSALLFLMADGLASARTERKDYLRPGPVFKNHAMWATAFVVTAIWAAGLPPSSGFLAKIMLLQAAQPKWYVWLPILVGSFLGILTLARAGKTLFLNNTLATQQTDAPSSTYSRWSLASMAWLGVALLIYTAWTSTFQNLGGRIAHQLATPTSYIHAVLGTKP
ncbi:MAG: monovalent cation/H+ antiporter subunit D [Rhodoferax sp.]